MTFQHRKIFIPRMNSQETNAQKLLLSILENPTGPAYSAMCSALSTEAGYSDFVQNLKGNNSLAFIFLKQYCQSWIDSRTMMFLHSEEFVLLLIDLCAQGSVKNSNMFYVGEFLEVLSINYLITEHILSVLVEQRNFVFLDNVFKKYTIHPRSNRLFAEINKSIELVAPVFRELYFQESVAKEVETEYQRIVANAQQACMSGESMGSRSTALFSDGNLLSVFYSLVYQDIHPFFEDNAEYFFKVFLILFEKEENREAINNIFDLYITKYPELTNFELIIITLSMARCADASLVGTLTKAFDYKRVFPELVTSFVKRALKDTDSTIDDDWLQNTRNMLKGIDIQRGCFHKLLRLLSPSAYAFEGEHMLFVASVLKYKDMHITGIASQLVSQYSDDKELVFSAFYYLITAQEYGLCNLGYLDTDLRFICMKFISSTLRSRDSFHKDAMFRYVNTMSFVHGSDIESVPSSPALGDWDHDALALVLGKCLGTADEFSSELMFRIVKNNSNLLTAELYEFITRIFGSISSIAISSATYLFDVYNLLTVKLKRINLGIVEHILNNDFVDLYGLCFYHLSILIKETAIKQSFVIQVLGQDALWSFRELHPSLSCMVISAYDKGMIGKESIQSICSILNGYPRVLVLHKTGVRTGVLESMEENYLVNGVFDSEWFVGNFMDRKYARLVLKAMMQDGRIDRRVKEEVFTKNRMNMEYEVVPHSIARYFDI